MVDDSELLKRYAEEKAQEAFAQLVQRHLALVYSIALRQCGGDAHLAEDVAQRVFTDLARKAAALTAHAAVSGWLCRCTHYAAADRVRAERRRRQREHTAFSMANLNESDAAPAWDRVRPLLDEVLAGLGDADRDALALRYFERRAFAATGEKLRLSEDSARKRVERALEKLRATLAQKGVRSTAGALAFALEQHAAVAVPPGLAATISGAALKAAPAVVGVSAVFGSKWLASLSAAVVIAGAGWVAYDAHLKSVLRREAEQLRETSRAVASLRSENERLRQLAAEVDSWRGDDAEFERLTRQIAVLRARRSPGTGSAVADPAPVIPVPRPNDLVSVKLPAADLTTLLKVLELYSGRTVVRHSSVPKIGRPVTLIEGPLPKQTVVTDLLDALRKVGVVVEPTADGSLLARLAN